MEYDEEENKDSDGINNKVIYFSVDKLDQGTINTNCMFLNQAKTGINNYFVFIYTLKLHGYNHSREGVASSLFPSLKIRYLNVS